MIDHDQTKDGYSICFNEWALDKNIKPELGLLLIISGLTSNNGYCFASNQYFADKFEITAIAVSRKIKKLERAGYIDIDYQRRGSEIVRREIRLTKMLIDRKQKSLSTVNKKVKESITSVNITSIKKESTKENQSTDKSVSCARAKKLTAHEKRVSKARILFQSYSSMLEKKYSAKPAQTKGVLKSLCYVLDNTTSEEEAVQLVEFYGCSKNKFFARNMYTIGLLERYFSEVYLQFKGAAKKGKRSLADVDVYHGLGECQ